MDKVCVAPSCVRGTLSAGRAVFITSRLNDTLQKKQRPGLEWIFLLHNASWTKACARPPLKHTIHANTHGA